MVEYESSTMRDRGHKCKKSGQGMGKEFVAGEVITQGTFVQFSGADDITVVTGAAAGPIIGIAMDTVATGDTIEVQMDGFHWIIVGTAADLVPGDWVMSDASGMAVEYVCPLAGAETTLGGYILSTPTDDEDCVCMKIQIDRICSVA